MKCTTQLSTDHKAILKALDLLNAIAAAWKKGQNQAPVDAAALIDFFKVFVDRCHHGKEESVFFARLNQAGMPTGSGPLSVMLYEHEEGRRLMRNIEAELAAGEAAYFAVDVDRYVHLLRDHISKEDEVLFSIAEGYLLNDDDAAMVEGFDAIERTMGEGTHERFHELLRTLASRYLREDAKAS